MRTLHSIFSLAVKNLWILKKISRPSLLDASGELSTKAKKVIRRILITRFQCVGDMILFIPTLRELRKMFPEAHITLLALEPSGVETIKSCPYIDDIILFRRSNAFREKWMYRLYLRRLKFDLFIASSAEINILREGFYAGAKYVIGFTGKRRFDRWVLESEPYLLDISLEYDVGMHETYQNLKIIEGLGKKSGKASLEYYLEQEDISAAENLLRSLPIDPGRPLVGIHPGSKQKGKRWPADRFAAVADHVVKQHDAQVAFIGSRDESDLVELIMKGMTGPGYDLTGKTSLGELAALIRKMSLLVCNDSGPMHMAAALGTPLIALYGPGNFANWHPLAEDGKATVIRHQVECSPCFAMNCDRAVCMERIHVAEVKTAVDNFLANHKCRQKKGRNESSYCHG